MQVQQTEYAKLIEEMENDVLQKKVPFPKTVGNMCRVLAGWKDNYAINYNWFSDANDEFAFATTDVPESKYKNKNKKIKCY